MSNNTKIDRKEIEKYLRHLSFMCHPGAMGVQIYLHREFRPILDKLTGELNLKKLTKDRGIQSPEELKQCINALTKKELSIHYKEVRNILAPLSMSERDAMVKQMEMTGWDGYRYWVVKSSMHVLPEAGITAYEIANFIYLCRVGRALHVLAPKEAFAKMLQAAQRAMELYSSWDAYMDAYIVGSAFNVKPEDDPRARPLKDHGRTHIYKLFMSSQTKLPKLPWRKEEIMSISASV